ncbi:hypothetical protein MHYP_G00321700 [Metynnis hypsauchen]
MLPAPPDLSEPPSIPCASIREESLEEEVVSRFRSNTSSEECDGGIVGGRERGKGPSLNSLTGAIEPQRCYSPLHACRTRRAAAVTGALVQPLVRVFIRPGRLRTWN